jgi:hypothetical protein
MSPQTAQTGVGGSESSTMTGASSNPPPAEEQQQYRWHVRHCDEPNAASVKISQEAYLNIFHGAFTA